MVLNVREIRKDLPYLVEDLTLDSIRTVMKKYNITLETLKASFKDDLKLWVDETRISMQESSSLGWSLLVMLYILRADRDFLKYLESCSDIWIPGFTWWKSGPYTSWEEVTDHRLADCCMKASIYIASRLGYSRKDHLAQIIDDWAKTYDPAVVDFRHYKDKGLVEIEVIGRGWLKPPLGMFSNLEHYFDIHYSVEGCKIRAQYY